MGGSEGSDTAEQIAGRVDHNGVYAKDMISWQQWPRSTKALALVLLAGVAAIVSALVPSPVGYLSWRADAPEVRAPPIPKLREPLALATYAAIAERPLFN